MAGGIGLMVGLINPGEKLLIHTDFESYFFPGVLLLCLVGGSAFAAVVLLYFRFQTASIYSLLAGIIMFFWIIAELAAIREFHFLQVIYVITASVVIYLSGMIAQEHKNVR